MADTFKKSKDEALSNPAEDGWKDVNIEREHQPEKVKSSSTYRQMEQQLETIDRDITFLTDEKTVLEAEMAKVKTTAEA